MQYHYRWINTKTGETGTRVVPVGAVVREVALEFVNQANRSNSNEWKYFLID
jgi:hypothetical protein